MKKEIAPIKLEIKDGKVFCDSLQIAEFFQKQHFVVLKAIKNLILSLEECEEVTDNHFIESEYKDTRGKVQPKFLLTRDGFSLLAMGFTGKEALLWKIKFIEAFNKMETKIFGNSKEWKAARKMGMVSRRNLTDSIKDYVELAVSQGSETYAKKPNLAYSNMTRMIKKEMGVENKTRDELDGIELNQLSVAENRASEVIERMIDNQEKYKDIYKDTRKELERIALSLGIHEKVFPKRKIESQKLPTSKM